MEEDVSKKPIIVEIDGIIFRSASRYYDGDTRKIAHSLKDGDKQAMERVAKTLSKYVPPLSVIVPIPNRCGYARETLELAKAISKYSGTPVADILKGNERLSLYDIKKEGKILTEKDLGFRKEGSLPLFRKPILLDNVCATGLTSFSAYHALGNTGEVLTFAIDDPLISRAKNVCLQQSFYRR